jgi:DNA topoisomerase-3
VDDEELKALMKENGIGRPSTRANIIETLFKRNYIEKKGKKILPTEIGIHLISVIHNPTLKSPELTGIWEKKLRQIENNEFSAPQFIKEMEELVHSLVTEVIYDIRPVEAKPIVCPKCKTGKIIKGKTAYGCSEWKGGCNFRIPFDMVSTEADVEKLIREGKVVANNKEVLLSGLV